MIAGDPDAVPPTAPGIEDAFSDPNLTDYVGTYSLGGDPFAQLCMELFNECPT